MLRRTFQKTTMKNSLKSIFVIFSILLLSVGFFVNEKMKPGKGKGNISFTDIDKDEGEFAGTVNVIRAKDESNLTHYILYFGHGSNTRLSISPVAKLEKTGSDLIYTLFDNTILPAGTTHLLVYTLSSDGKKRTYGSMKISDLVIPAHKERTAS